MSCIFSVAERKQILYQKPKLRFSDKANSFSYASLEMKKKNPFLTPLQDKMHQSSKKEVYFERVSVAELILIKSAFVCAVHRNTSMYCMHTMSN